MNGPQTLALYESMNALQGQLPEYLHRTLRHLFWAQAVGATASSFWQRHRLVRQALPEAYRAEFAATLARLATPGGVEIYRRWRGDQ